MTRGIIVLDRGAPEQQDRITLFLRNRNYQWWHYIDNLWLLSDLPVGVTPKAIWDEVTEATNLRDARILVIIFNTHVAHYGFLNSEAWPWLAQHFGPPQ